MLYDFGTEVRNKWIGACNDMKVVWWHKICLNIKSDKHNNHGMIWQTIEMHILYYFLRNKWQ